MKLKLVLGIILALFLVTTFSLAYDFPQIIAEQDYLGVPVTENPTDPKDPHQSGTITISNGILEVAIEDVAGGGGIGVYTISTGSAHPNPGEDVFYNGWTTYTTVKVVDTLREYVTITDALDPSSGYTLENLDAYILSVVQDSAKVTITWSIPEGLRITQVVEVTGNSLSDTLVRVTVDIFNNAQVPYTVGIRHEWDIMIDGEDGSYLRPWSDLGLAQTWLDVETEWISPNFQFWEITNAPTDPLFSIYGSISSPTQVTLSSTKPDKFVFASWGDCYDFAYDYLPTDQNIGGTDSAVLYYWDPIEVIPGSSREATSYVTTFKEAIESGSGIYRQPIHTIRLAEVAIVAGALTVATTLLTSLSALGQAFNSAVSMIPIPDKLRSFLKTYGKKTFESVDKVKLDALENAPFISKEDLISLGLSILTLTLVYGYVEANGFPRFFDPSVFAVVIPPTLISVAIVSIAGELSAALCAQTNQVYRQFRLWFFGLTGFLISGLILMFPFSTPGITRYQSREISDQTKGLIVLFKMLVYLTLAIPFTVFYLLGFKVIGDVGLLMILMKVCYSLVPLKPLAGRAVFDYKKEVSLLALGAAAILLYSYSIYLLPYITYLALGAVAGFLAVRIYNRLQRLSDI